MQGSATRKKQAAAATSLRSAARMSNGRAPYRARTERRRGTVVDSDESWVSDPGDPSLAAADLGPPPTQAEGTPVLLRAPCRALLPLQPRHNATGLIDWALQRRASKLWHPCSGRRRCSSLIPTLPPLLGSSWGSLRVHPGFHVSALQRYSVALAQVGFPARKTQKLPPIPG